jgi:hypothetical protein
MSQPAGPYSTKSDFAYTQLRVMILSGEFHPGHIATSLGAKAAWRMGAAASSSAPR